MGSTGSREVRFYVHVYVHMPGYAREKMGRIRDRPKSQDGPLLIDSDFLSFPQSVIGREKVCAFTVRLLFPLGYFTASCFPPSLFIQVGSMLER